MNKICYRQSAQTYVHVWSRIPSLYKMMDRTIKASRRGTRGHKAAHWGSKCRPWSPGLWYDSAQHTAGKGEAVRRHHRRAERAARIQGAPPPPLGKGGVDADLTSNSAGLGCKSINCASGRHRSTLAFHAAHLLRQWPAVFRGDPHSQ